jgi:DNA-binding transcriptional ArsR family regulator
MVVGEVERQRAVDRVFHALADATRRDILVRTLQAEYSVSALARLYPMTFAAVQKHVAVLAGAELVAKRRHGREQLITGNIETIRRTSRLLDELEVLWRARIDRIGAILAEDPTGGTNT